MKKKSYLLHRIQAVPMPMTKNVNSHIIQSVSFPKPQNVNVVFKSAADVATPNPPVSLPNDDDVEESMEYSSFHDDDKDGSEKKQTTEELDAGRDDDALTVVSESDVGDAPSSNNAGDAPNSNTEMSVASFPNQVMAEPDDAHTHTHGVAFMESDVENSAFQNTVDAADRVIIFHGNEDADDIRKSFEATRQSLKQMFTASNPKLDDAIRRMQTTPTVPDAYTECPNFYRYYRSLTDNGVDVLNLEFQKRNTLRHHVQTTLATAHVPSFVAHLLFVLGAKTFVVAFYAITHRVAFDKLIHKTIFDIRPGLGVDVDDVFDKHVHVLYNKGADLLELSFDFRTLLNQENVSYHELFHLVEC